jgi:hypothetical protein
VADSLTANYGWTKPDIGASDDTWGDKWNVNLDGIDAQLRTVQDGVVGPPGPQGPIGPPGPQGPQGPGAAFPDAPNTSQRFGRFNSTWQLDAIQTDAAADSNAYGRVNNAWATVLATTGGTITGSLTVNQVLTVQGANSLVLNAAMGNQRAILAQTSGISRWQLQLADLTNEGLNNVGSNFALSAFSNTGAFLGNWLTIARADGTTVLNGPVTMNYGLGVNGLLAVNSVGNFYLPGGSSGQVLSTNGSGVLSWITPPGASGGIPDAPNDGTTYARKSAAWAHLTHTDITDWSATLSPYALTASVPVASTTTPLMDGTAAVGTGTTWARADHVHPTDTSRYAASNPSGFQTAAQVTAALPPASTTVPLVDGIAAIGVGTTYARADHVHPLPPQAMGDNRIINGDMRIDQRNNGAATTPTNTIYPIDRWQMIATQTAKFNVGRNLGPPGSFAPGFPYCLGFSSTSAYPPLAGDTFGINQPIEADMVSDFAWGTANAQPVTLSFWVLTSSLTGTFSGAIRNANTPTRSYPFTYSIPTANTWTKIAVTIPGDTAGTWAMSGNGTGVQVAFDLGGSTTFRAPANAWAAGNFVGATGAVSVVATNGAAFYVTGVKLEIGNVATPYNRQSLAKSMADCQRYYQSISVIGAAGYNTAGGNIYGNPTFPVMRANPTIVLSNISYTNASALNVTSITVSTFTAYATATAAGNAVASATMALSAEL